MINICIENDRSFIKAQTLSTGLITALVNNCSYSLLGSGFSAAGTMQWCPKCKKQAYTADEIRTEEARKRGCHASDIALQEFPVGQMYCKTHGFITPIKLWDGGISLFNKTSYEFPTGILSKVIAVLKEQGEQYTLDDRRIRPESHFIGLKGVTLRDYQKKAVDAIVGPKAGGRGTLRLITGAGKTLIIAGITAELGVKTLILVPSRAIFNQIYERLSKFLQVPIGRIGDSVCDIKDITVGMPQSLTTTMEIKKRTYNKFKRRWEATTTTKVIIRPEYEEYLKTIQCFIMDECHHAAASSFICISDALPNAFYRVGLTSTHFRDDQADILIDAFSGRRLVDVCAKDLIAAGYLSKPIIHLIPFRQPPIRGKGNYTSIYSKYIVNNTNRNNLVVDIVVNQAAKNKSVLVPVRYISHGKILLNLLKEKLGDKVDFVDSTTSTKELTEALTKLQNKELLCLVSTSVLGEGTDVPSIDSVVMCSSVRSGVQALQNVGRALRRTADKSVVDIYDISDYGCRWFGEHSHIRRLFYESEPGFEIIEEKEND